MMYDEFKKYKETANQVTPKYVMDNGHNKYKEMMRQTVPKSSQLMMLFGELVGKMTLSRQLMQENKFSESNKLLIKCMKIFERLVVSLDMRYEISEQLMELYVFINEEILKAIVEKDVRYLDGILPIISELRETWDTANTMTSKSKFAKR